MEAGAGVRGAAGVGDDPRAGVLQMELVVEGLRERRRAVADDDDLRALARPLDDVRPVPGRCLAAGDSAEVAQEDQHGGTIAPGIAECALVAVGCGDARGGECRGHGLAHRDGGRRRGGGESNDSEHGDHRSPTKVVMRIGTWLRR